MAVLLYILVFSAIFSQHFGCIFQALITKHTFSLLPPSYQYKLICLMPECDKIVGKDGALRYVCGELEGVTTLGLQIIIK